MDIDNISENECVKQEICNNIKTAMRKYMPADKLDDIDDIFYSCAEGYEFERKENN